MTFAEKTTDLKKLRHWDGNMECDYIYTSGLAGERFFTELKKTGKFYATRCERCGVTYFPPRIYCERCLGEIRDWKEVPLEGTIEAFTTARLDEEGRELETPEVWALVKLPGVNGVLVHKVSVPPEKVKRGLRVRAKLKPAMEMTGEITDIESFTPI